MDTTQHLATESFSYSWLATKSSSSETKSNQNISNNNNNETIQNFNFDISTPKSNSSSLVHADKLFSNGLILPRSLDAAPSKPRNKYNASFASSSSSPSPLLVHSKIHHPSMSSLRGMFIGKWWRSKLIPRKILSKYIKCLIPMKESIGRVDDHVNRLAWEVKSWSTNNTPVIASPMRSETTAYCSAWSDIDESSVREAILYCKRSSSGLC